MKFKQIIFLTFLLTSLNSIHLNAQNKEIKSAEKGGFLKGLTKANGNDLLNKEILLDGKSFPVYTIEGKRVEGIEISKIMGTGNYYPKFYVNKDNEIKAAVLETLTEKEKNRRKKSLKMTENQRKLIGTEATVFSATDINGNEYSLNNLKGKVIVMNFWFVECKPCVMEIPELNKLVEKYKNVVFLGFATNDKSQLDSFLKKNDFFYNIIPNSRKIADEYKVMGYPTHIVIDGNSKIRYFTTGLGPTTISDMEKNIESLIKE